MLTLLFANIVDVEGPREGMMVRSPAESIMKTMEPFVDGTGLAGFPWDSCFPSQV